jgi:death-on-curing protein
VKQPLWIEEREVLAIHGRLLALHGGAAGLRDEGLLQSALARPRQHHAYAEALDIVEMAALYTDGIVSNHPFMDGNKRTGFVVGVLFLELNGLKFIAREEDATQAVMSLAASKLDEAGYAAWLRTNSKRK